MTETSRLPVTISDIWQLTSYQEKLRNSC